MTKMVKKLERACLRNPVKIEASSKYSTIDTLKQQYRLLPAKHKDYIHRVGRTTRAGRSGLAVSLVNQYEVEQYLQIEKLIDKKLPEYPAEEEEVLVVLEGLTDAKRIAQMSVREGVGDRKRRRGRDDDDDEEEDYRDVVTCKSAKASKKGKRH